MSCGHMEGVRAENGPPGVGLKSDPPDDVCFVVAETLTPSPVDPVGGASSSSSDSVSARIMFTMSNCHLMSMCIYSNI